MVHNHPIGDPTASRDDLDVTREITAAGTLRQATRAVKKIRAKVDKTLPKGQRGRPPDIAGRGRWGEASPCKSSGGCKQPWHDGAPAASPVVRWCGQRKVFTVMPVRW
jgi:hypothetical protein